MSLPEEIVPVQLLSVEKAILPEIMFRKAAPGAKMEAGSCMFDTVSSLDIIVYI